MPSLDVVSRVDFHEIDNAINNAKKALAARFDFRGVRAEMNLDQKAKTLQFITEDGSKMESLKEMFVQAAVKRGLSMKSFGWEDVEPGPAGSVKRTVKIRDGLEQDLAKQIVKVVKETGLKVQASIQGDEVRLSGKKIDDLQACMAALRAADLPAPLQFVNMKS